MTGFASTLAAVEQAVYVCQTSGAQSSTCKAQAVAAEIAILNSPVGLLTGPHGSVLLANLNFLESVAGLRSKLSGGPLVGNPATDINY